MGKWTFKTMLYSLLIGWIVLFGDPLGLAKGNNVLRTQGLINPGGNPAAGYLIINEMRVYIEKKTELWDHRKMAILITELTPKKWVYMEIEKNSNGKIKASKIYLLPRYVNPEERKRFSFMN
jgi:hypothetical protein